MKKKLTAAAIVAAALLMMANQYTLAEQQTAEFTQMHERAAQLADQALEQTYYKR